MMTNEEREQHSMQLRSDFLAGRITAEEASEKLFQAMKDGMGLPDWHVARTLAVQCMKDLIAGQPLCEAFLARLEKDIKENPL